MSDTLQRDQKLIAEARAIFEEALSKSQGLVFRDVENTPGVLWELHLELWKIIEVLEQARTEAAQC